MFEAKPTEGFKAGIDEPDAVPVAPAGDGGPIDTFNTAKLKQKAEAEGGGTYVTAFAAASIPAGGLKSTAVKAAAKKGPGAQMPGIGDTVEPVHVDPVHDDGVHDGIGNVQLSTNALGILLAAATDKGADLQPRPLNDGITDPLADPLKTAEAKDVQAPGPQLADMLAVAAVGTQGTALHSIFTDHAKPPVVLAANITTDPGQGVTANTVTANLDDRKETLRKAKAEIALIKEMAAPAGPNDPAELKSRAPLMNAAFVLAGANPNGMGSFITFNQAPAHLAAAEPRGEEAKRTPGAKQEGAVRQLAETSDPAAVWRQPAAIAFDTGALAFTGATLRTTAVKFGVASLDAIEEQLKKFGQDIEMAENAVDKYKKTREVIAGGASKDHLLTAEQALAMATDTPEDFHALQQKRPPLPNAGRMAMV